MNPVNWLTSPIAITFLLVSSLPADETAPAKSDPPAESYVKPIDLVALAKRYQALPERDKAVIRLYMKGAQRYVLTLEDGAFPNPGLENWRNIAERAHGAAVLAMLPNEWPEELREKCRKQSVQFIKDFVAEYRKDRFLGDNEKLRGCGLQVTWWASEMGTAAWFLWDQLDADLRKNVADMVAFHADYQAGKEPGTQVALDTEAETVAWDSAIFALAINMMPNHPHNDKWRQASKRYLYTVFATPKDTKDETPGDDGKPIKDWVAGANIHDDFTLKNHGIFHIDYVSTCYRFIIHGAALYRLGGNPVPKAFRHHTRDVYEQTVLPCTNGGKFAVFVADNDWKRYHLWTESSAMHGYIALTESSSLASTLEEQSLRESVALWQEFPEKFTYDNPYVCGKAWTPRVADIVLLHLLSKPMPEPLPADKAEAQLQGVHRKHYINLLTQYSKEGSFRSFYWGPGPTVRHVEPRKESWMMLPLHTDYGIVIDGKLLPETRLKTTAKEGDNWFSVMRQYARGEGEAFVSLPDEVVVMMATVPGAASKGTKKLDILAGVEKPHKAFDIYHQGGKATFRPGQKVWERTDKVEGLAVESRWLNLADDMGYVVVNLSKESSRMQLPKPGVRDSLILHHVEAPGRDQHFVIVALPNQDHERTAAAASKITGAYADGVMSCVAPPYLVWANFSDKEATLRSPGPVKCSANSAGFVRMEEK